MDETKPCQYNKVLQLRGEFLILINGLAMVSYATISTEEVIFHEGHYALKEVFWTFVGVQAKGGKVKHVAPCGLESKVQSDGMPYARD